MPTPINPLTQLSVGGDDARRFVNYLPSHNEPVLVALITGALARRLHGQTDALAVAHIVNVLKIMYGKANVPEPVDSLVSE